MDMLTRTYLLVETSAWLTTHHVVFSDKNLGLRLEVAVLSIALDWVF